jgi:general secretion pathway protein G
MLVLGILVVLAAFVVPALRGTSLQARIMAAKAQVGSTASLATAIALFHQQIGQLPEQLVDLVERPDYVDDDDDRWYKFLEQPNFTDPWGNELVYRQEGEVNEDSYDLLSKGPDGEEDTEDDVGNFRKED